MAYGLNEQMMQGFTPQAPQNTQFGGGYLNTGGLNPDVGKGTWEDYVRQLGFSNLDNMTDFQSPLYQQYAQFLQKTSPQIGANTLLAPLMAGGTGYAGGQNIANEKLKSLTTERQDKINTGVQGFGLQMQQNILSQVGQIGGSFTETANRLSRDKATDAASSPWAMIGGAVGSGLGMLNPLNLFGGGASSMQGQPAVGGYR